MKKIASLILVLCSLGLAPALAGSGATTTTKALTEWVSFARQNQTNQEHCFNARIPGNTQLLAQLHTREAGVQFIQQIRLFIPKQIHTLQLHQRITAEEYFQS